MMDSNPRLYSCQQVESTLLYFSIVAIENHFMSSFWSPNATQGDVELKHDSSQQYLKRYDIQFFQLNL